MTTAASLLGLTLLMAPATAALAQTTKPPATITVNRTADGKGWHITLPPSVINTVTDQYWLTIDGKAEGFGGDYYNPDFFPKMPLRYAGNVSNNLDGQVKDILEAQGLPTKANVTTYHITCGINSPDSVSISKSLSFRHESNLINYTQFSSHASYRVGDKIPIFEAVALDSSVVTSGILGKSVEKQNQLPHDLLHRITIQVQFVPKTKEEGAASPGADKKRG